MLGHSSARGKTCHDAESASHIVTLRWSPSNCAGELPASGAVRCYDSTPSHGFTFLLPSRAKRFSHRPEGEDVLADAAILQRNNRLRGGALIRRGVYRFRNHEEADEWMIKEMANSRAPELEDLVSLCKALNDHEVRYVLIGGFAVIIRPCPQPGFVWVSRGFATCCEADALERTPTSWSSHRCCGCPVQRTTPEVARRRARYVLLPARRRAGRRRRQRTVCTRGA